MSRKTCETPNRSRRRGVAIPTSSAHPTKRALVMPRLRELGGCAQASKGGAHGQGPKGLR
eukprot:620921-Pyramimonas_sp.AAC.1